MTWLPATAARLAVVAWVALAAAWIGGSPPFAGPDESAHYLRALQVGGGELIGPRAPYPVPAGPPDAVARARFQGQTTRLVQVPAGLSAGGYDCNALRADRSAACQHGIRPPGVATAEIDPVGSYAPAAYLLPGVAMRLASTPPAGDRLARAAQAVACLTLLAAAAALLALGAPSGLPLLGLLAAVTPMAVYVMATLNPSGLEIASGIAFLAALLRLARDAEPGAGPWLAAGASGALLAVVRAPSPGWLILDLGVPLGLLGVTRARARVRTAGRAAAAAGALLVAGVAANRLWEAAYGAATPFGLTPFPDRLRHALAFQPTLLREQVGVFGYLDTYLPRPVYAAWLGLVAVLVVAALVVGTTRERAVVAAVATVTAAVPVLLDAAVLQHTGFAAQGRHVLPLTAAVPLVAGEVLARRRARLGRTFLRLLPVVGAVVGVVHLAAFWIVARREAVGTGGPLWFPERATWSPPLGWWPWLVLAAAGALLLAATGAAAVREGRWQGRREAG